MRKDIAGRPVPDSLPETPAVIADPEGVAWVADFVVPGEGNDRRWDVDDPEAVERFDPAMEALGYRIPSTVRDALDYFRASEQRGEEADSPETGAGR